MPNSTPTDREVVFRQYLNAVGLHGVAGAAAAGLHASEWYALSQITLEGSITSGELAVRTGLTTGATTRLIDRLERAGYVRRADHPADRRKVVVEPVTDALTVINDLVAPARRRVAEVLARYTPDQLDVLFDYFTHAAPAFRESTEDIRATAAHHRRGAEPGGAP